MTIAEFTLGTKATAIAEDIEARMDAQLRLVTAADVADQITAVCRGAQRVVIPPSVPQGLQDELNGYIHNLAYRRLWQRSKVVYAIHPDMRVELDDCTSTEMPTDVFTMLPHRDPLVIFAEPVLTTTPNDEQARVLGFAVCGRTDEAKSICSTHDDGVDGLGLLFIIGIYDDNGIRVDTEVTRCTIPLSGDRFTVEQAVERTLSRFALGPDGVLRKEKLRTWLGELLRTAVTTLLYLCTDEVDVQEAPKPRKPGKKKDKSRDRKDKPTRLLKIGWHLGPELARLRRVVAKQPWRVGVTGLRQPPHQRRCHIREQRYGPGRSQMKLKFIKPYWVSLDLLDDDSNLPHTVVPVMAAPQPKGDVEGSDTPTRKGPVRQ